FTHNVLFNFSEKIILILLSPLQNKTLNHIGK
ncbi:MAG: hypothetical protein ACI9VI_003251, partial [Candidatus Azotimanducaceae bacterium]